MLSDVYEMLRDIYLYQFRVSTKDVNLLNAKVTRRLKKKLICELSNKSYEMLLKPVPVNDSGYGSVKLKCQTSTITILSLGMKIFFENEFSFSIFLPYKMNCCI